MSAASKNRLQRALGAQARPQDIVQEGVTIVRVEPPPASPSDAAPPEMPAQLEPEPQPEPELRPEPEPRPSRRSKRANGRALPSEPSSDAADEQLAAVIAQARKEELPKPPIGRWIAARWPVAKSPLDNVQHVGAPSKPSGLPVIVSSGSTSGFVMTLCGCTLMVDANDVTRDDYTPPALPRCGWCVTALIGATVPDYADGKRRPVLPGMPAVRERTRDPQREAQLLQAENDYALGMARMEKRITRMTDGWVPNKEEMEELQADMQALQAADRLRLQAKAEQRLTERGQSQARSEAPAEPRARAQRTVVRVPKSVIEGIAPVLPEPRGADGKVLGVLFRTLDPKGPFLVGRRLKMWTVRDIRTGEDKGFAKDKRAAIAYVDEQIKGMSETERTKGIEDARARMQANDVNRRSR